MNQEFLDRAEKIDELQKAHIMGNFANSDQVLKSEDQLDFEDKVKKGEVEVITLEDVKEDYGDKYFLKSDIDKFEDDLEVLIKKGEEEFLTEEEWDALSKGRADIEKLEAKAIAVQKGDKSGYLEVLVIPQEDAEEEV